ncbi:hypothetical protein AB0K35_28300 [Micromonospora sp. NPDC053740]|uniref:hypothetical protein n=1 Tax=Micromonospora sp. NPDC053740 TaxID=3155173 RepID=UPI0034137EB6
MTANHKHERLIDSINGGHIRRNPHTWAYGDDRNESRDVTTTLYELDDLGWVDLYPDGTVVVTKAGQEWRDRPRRRTGDTSKERRALTDPFSTGDGRVA